LFHSAEGDPFDDDTQRCQLVNDLFWGESGNDVQVRSDPNGITEIAHCAYAPGQYVCEGVPPTATVTLVTFPFAAADDYQLAAESPCIDAGLELGLSPDLAGVPVPLGDGTDIGAYEYTGDVVAVPAQPATIDLRCIPNPFNPRGILAFSLARAAIGELAVYDLAGRRVKNLGHGHWPAGRHRVTWDGTDAGGRQVAAGIYLACFRGSGITAVSRLTLVR
jgi:hypothetical protein